MDDVAKKTPIGADAESFEAEFPEIEAEIPEDFSFGNDHFSSSQIIVKNSIHSESDPFVAKKARFIKLDSSSEYLFGGKKKLKNKPLPTEDLQLFWAEQESLRLEEERRKQEAQEVADVEYALALSKKDFFNF